MYKNLLPIGSIVRLIEGERKLMVCGRIVCKDQDETIYDYVGCLYPQGITSSSGMYFFNRDVIEDVYFIGFQDKEEMEYRHGVLDQLGELQVVDGRIVQKNENA
jgi:hypothetical protein